MAAQLTSASYYFCTTAPPAWVNIEQESIPDLPLNLYLYPANIKILRKCIKNPVLKNTVSVWHAAHKHIGDLPLLSRFIPIWGNEQFTPGKKDGGFRHSENEDRVLLTFEQLCQRYQIPKKNTYLNTYS